MAILINGVQVAGVGLPGKDGVDGKDATINGVSALTLTATGGISGQQSGNTYTLDGSGLMEKVSGLQGQLLGFTDENVVGAVDAPTGGGAGKRVCRFVVGTSTAGWAEDDCDYLCDGTDDQEEINAAIQALPGTGGEIVILDGTYNITAPIALNRTNSTLRGNGAATVLKRMWDSSTAEGIVDVSVDSCTVRDLYFNGNKTEYTSTKNYGINVKKNNNVVTNNVCNNNRYGMHISGGNNTVTNNTCDNNKEGMDTTGNSNIITNNICNNNESYGIYVSGKMNNFTNNICYNNSAGIYVAGYKCVIAGNTCIRGYGTTGEYSESQYTIHLVGSDNLVSANICSGKAPSDVGNRNTLVNNKYE